MLPVTREYDATGHKTWNGIYILHYFAKCNINSKFVFILEFSYLFTEAVLIFGVWDMLADFVFVFVKIMLYLYVHLYLYL